MGVDVFLIIAMFLMCIVNLKIVGEIDNLKYSRKKIYKRLNRIEDSFLKGKRGFKNVKGDKIC